MGISERFMGLKITAVVPFVIQFTILPQLLTTESVKACPVMLVILLFWTSILFG